MKPEPEQLNASSIPLTGEKIGDKVNWQTWYWLVLGALAVEIGFFAYLTNLFA